MYQTGLRYQSPLLGANLLVFCCSCWDSLLWYSVYVYSCLWGCSFLPAVVEFLGRVDSVTVWLRSKTTSAHELELNVMEVPSWQVEKEGYQVYAQGNLLIIWYFYVKRSARLFWCNLKLLRGVHCTGEYIQYIYCWPPLFNGKWSCRWTQVSFKA